MSKEAQTRPQYIMTREELSSFPTETFFKRAPPEIRVATGCIGIIVRPLIMMTGQGDILKQLDYSEMQEMVELLRIVRDDNSWSQLDPVRQLDVRVRTSRLVQQYAISRTTTFKG